jgi:hypothetical protein
MPISDRPFTMHEYERIETPWQNFPNFEQFWVSFAHNDAFLRFHYWFAVAILRIAHDDLCPPLQLEFFFAGPIPGHDARGRRAGAQRVAGS